MHRCTVSVFIVLNVCSVILYVTVLIIINKVLYSVISVITLSIIVIV